MDTQKVREFTRNLRQLELLVVSQLREDTCCHGVSVAQCHCLLAVEQLGRPASKLAILDRICRDHARWPYQKQRLATAL